MNLSSKPVVIVGAGQSGLTGAQAVREAGLSPVVVESSERAAGSWPHFYDSLAAFSPARFSAIPGHPFPGDPDGYPTRDAVASYLEDFAATVEADIRTGTTVTRVDSDGGGFVVHTDRGEAIEAAGVVAATGAFGNPYRPHLPGPENFAGEVIHVAQYRNPEPYQGKRVVVVGAGNSAVQVAVELADVACVTVASHQAPSFVPQLIGGKDVHHYLSAGFDDLPPRWLATLAGGPLVLDTGGYRKAFDTGLLERKGMFANLYGDAVEWSDGTTEHVDAIILATGYRPHLGYLKGLGALDPTGLPLHDGGISTTHPGLVYLGLEFQRSFASNTLRGVATDAAHVTKPLAAFASGVHLAFAG